MNTIHLQLKRDIGSGRFVVPFTCSDIANKGIRTELPRLDRTETENKVLDTVWDRITLALQRAGYEVEVINFRNMAITVMESKRKV